MFYWELYLGAGGRQVSVLGLLSQAGQGGSRRDVITDAGFGQMHRSNAAGRGSGGAVPPAGTRARGRVTSGATRV